MLAVGIKKQIANDEDFEDGSRAEQARFLLNYVLNFISCKTLLLYAISDIEALLKVLGAILLQTTRRTFVNFYHPKDDPCHTNNITRGFWFLGMLMSLVVTYPAAQIFSVAGNSVGYVKRAYYNGVKLTAAIFQICTGRIERSSFVDSFLNLSRNGLTLIPAMLFFMAYFMPDSKVGIGFSALGSLLSPLLNIKSEFESNFGNLYSAYLLAGTLATGAQLYSGIVNTTLDNGLRKYLNLNHLFSPAQPKQPTGEELKEFRRQQTQRRLSAPSSRRLSRTDIKDGKQDTATNGHNGGYGLGRGDVYTVNVRPANTNTPQQNMPADERGLGLN